jgi:hypothetical protein
MEERNNKSNTMLLTVIAIATLLVAVIGATFAYFTSRIQDVETASTVLLKGTNLTISFSDSNPDLSASEGLVPVKSVNGVFAPVITKTFSLTGTNPSTSTLNYTLYLAVTDNTFALKHPTTGVTSLTYKFTSSNNGGEAPEANGQSVNIPVLDKTNLGSTRTAQISNYNENHNGNDAYAILQTEDLQNSIYYLHNDTQNRGYNNGTGVVGEEGTAIHGLRLGRGTIAAAANNTTPTIVTHEYTLNIYFNENEKVQDFDKGATFSGYVAIDADPITTAEA